MEEITQVGWDSMVTERQQKALKRVQEQEAERGCSTYVDDLPLDPLTKERVFDKCMEMAKEQTVEEWLATAVGCAISTTSQHDHDLCVGHKTLNPKSPLTLPEMKVIQDQMAVLEREALKAPNKSTEEDFRQWMYPQISIPELNLADSDEDNPLADVPPSPNAADGGRSSGPPPNVPTSPPLRVGGVYIGSYQEMGGTEPVLHAPSKVIKISESGKDDITREESKCPPVHTITLTQKFGIDPCDKTNTVASKIFSRFEKVTNRLIRAGASLPDDLFEKKGTTATKRFYDRTRNTPTMEALWQGRDAQPFQLNERAWRCTAQHAYFAVRDYKVRLRLLRHFVETLQATADLSLIFDPIFPQDEVFNAIYSRLPLIERDLTGGQVSRVYLGNVLREMRNIVKQGFHSSYGDRIADILHSQPTPPHLVEELGRWLARDLPKFLGAYLKILSRRLTAQVKRILKRKTPRRTLPKTKQGALIGHILMKNNLPIDILTAKSWERARQKWREETKEILERKSKSIDVTILAYHAVQEGQRGLTLDRVVSLLFNFRPRRLQLGSSDLAGFKAYLVQRAITELEYRSITLLKPHLALTMHQMLAELLVAPRSWVKLPHFQKQTIPFGADDDRVYKDKELQDLFILAQHRRGVAHTDIIQSLLRKQLFKRGSEKYQEAAGQTREYIEKLLEFDKKVRWFEQVETCKIPIRFQLRLEIGNPMDFELRTPKRFLKLMQEGYAPQKATLMRKRGGGLILAIPFEKCVPMSQYLGRSDLPQTQDLVIAGLDPGLKTLATLSIGVGDALTAGAWGQAGREVARYFYDQKQLGERRMEWFKPLGSKARPRNYKAGVYPNVKRRLYSLRQELRRCQSERDAYRNACLDKGIDYRHKERFWMLNSAVKRIWNNLSALHDELTRQIATCILAACEHHGVRLLRMEDLRWAKHSRKYEVSYYLASNQIHWFFGQIQARVAELAPRRGIFVEWVNAKHTSSRCSKCGHISKTKKGRRQARQGKIFKCPRCGFQLDADLNAARNIRIAPYSNNIPPSLYALRGGSPYIPSPDVSPVV